MKIKLTRTGGFIPVTRSAETDVEMTEIELGRLIEIIKRDNKGYKVKDANYYELSAGKITTSIDLEKVPEKYKDLFGRLKAGLKIQTPNSKL
jgi:hypothetical protein